MKKCCILTWLCEIINKYKFILVPLISLLIIYVFFLTFLTFLTNFRVNNLESLHYATLIILTFLLVLVAWVQLSKIHSVSQSEFLLKVFTHLSDESIIKAMKILHRLRLETEDECKNDNLSIPKKINEKISKKILELRGDYILVNNFIYLKNFLDYLEHISYLCEEGEISRDDIQSCLDERIRTYYAFYKDLIEYYKDKNPQYRPYQSFESLAGKYSNND